jgi:large subunit ribosomal protein L24
MNIRKGDNVKVTTGKDSGKTGKVIRVLTSDNKVIVENVNMFKKHARPRKQGEKGEIVSIAHPIAASNVMVVCGNCGKPVRVGSRRTEKKVERFCKKCNATI